MKKFLLLKLVWRKLKIWFGTVAQNCKTQRWYASSENIQWLLVYSCEWHKVKRFLTGTVKSHFSGHAPVAKKTHFEKN